MGKPRACSDSQSMNKKVLWMCMAVGSTIGGYLPTFIGQGSFSIASIIGSFVRGGAGVFPARSIDPRFLLLAAMPPADAEPVGQPCDARPRRAPVELHPAAVWP